jgi:hypothetical protein
LGPFKSLIGNPLIFNKTFIIKPFLALVSNLRTIILKPSFIISILIYIVGMIGFGIFTDTVSFDGSDDEGVSSETKSKDSDSDNIKHVDQQNSEPKDDSTPEGSSQTNLGGTNYSNSSKWYVERMKHVYEQMMEHESKWLEDEKVEYERTKVLPDNSLHSTIAESREQDAKEMLAINEALNKFYLNENPNDIGSSDNKRSIVEDDQLSIASEENKKPRIVVENETNVDNITNKINSNNK